MEATQQQNEARQLPALAGTVVLVTGASSGIGEACARHLAARGHRVYGTSRTARSGPPGVRMLAMDVTQDASVQAAVATVLAEAGRIDVLVNNAGIALAGAVEDCTLEEAQRQFDTNFFGALRVVRAVLPGMRARGDGLVVQMSSLGGRLGLPFQGLYSASKYALEGLTEALRLEVAPFGVRVTLLEPGDVRTPITDHRTVARAAREGSPYQRWFDAALEVIAKEERAGASPDAVAQRVLALMAQRSPPVRSSVGHLSQRLLTASKALLPARAFERFVGAYYGLGR